MKKVKHRLLINFCGTGLTDQQVEQKETIASLFHQVDEKKKAAIFNGPGSAQPIFFTHKRTIGLALSFFVLSPVLGIPALLLTGATLLGAAIDNYWAWGTGILFGTTGKNNILENAEEAVKFVEKYKADHALQDEDLEITAIGYSRGGVTCDLFANEMQTKGLKSPINIIEVDPVPGPDLFNSFTDEVKKLGDNVKSLTILVATQDRTPLFTMLRPETAPNTTVTVVGVPANHLSVVNQEKNALSLTPKESEDEYKVGLFVNTVVHQLVYLRGAPISPITVPEDLKGYQHPTEEEKLKKIQNGSPFVIPGKSTRYVSDYHEGDGEAKPIDYPMLNELAPFHLAVITPFIEEARGHIEILTQFGANDKFIQNYERLIDQTISQALEFKGDRSKHLGLKLKQLNEAAGKIVRWAKPVWSVLDSSESPARKYLNSIPLNPNIIEQHFTYSDSILSSLSQLRDRSTGIQNANRLNPKANQLLDQFLGETAEILSDAEPGQEVDMTKLSIINGLGNYLVDGVRKGKWTSGHGIAHALDLVRAIKDQKLPSNILNSLEKFIKKGTERCGFMAEAIAKCSKEKPTPLSKSLCNLFGNPLRSQQLQTLRKEKEYAQVNESLRFQISKSS